MKNNEFQEKVFENFSALKEQVARIEERAISGEKRLTAVEDSNKDHERGHMNFRIASGTAIFGMLVKVFWPIK